MIPSFLNDTHQDGQAHMMTGRSSVLRSVSCQLVSFWPNLRDRRSCKRGTEEREGVGLWPMSEMIEDEIMQPQITSTLVETTLAETCVERRAVRESYDQDRKWMGRTFFIFVPEGRWSLKSNPCQNAIVDTEDILSKYRLLDAMRGWEQEERFLITHVHFIFTPSQKYLRDSRAPKE